MLSPTATGFSASMTDQKLYQGLRKKDPEIFRELVAAHQQSVVRICYSIVHDLEDAKDLAQDVFLQMLDSVDSFRGDARISSWIYRIAVNKSLNHIRKMKRNQMAFLSANKHPVHSSGRDDLLDTRDPIEEQELRSQIYRAIDKLPVNQRIAFNLFHYEGLHYKEIAEIMDTSLFAVESLMHRAKKRLQKTLKQVYHEQKS